MKNLSQEQIIKLAVREGIKVAMERVEFERNKDRKQAKDKRLYNTKLLLKNYRAFKAHAERSVFDAADCEDAVFDVLAMMSDSAFSRAENTVESIKNSAERTAIMVGHITTMLETYKSMCECSGKEENNRRYRVIYALYIADKPESAEEIAERECIDRRTVYKDVDAAAEALSPLLFGVDGVIRQ